jgi:hypothetical protein
MGHMWYVLIIDKYVFTTADEYYMSSIRQIDTLLSAATQSILSQIVWNETFKVISGTNLVQVIFNLKLLLGICL